MKPSPQYDFAISVRRQPWEEAERVAGLYEGIFDVTLNHSFSVMFVPAVDRSAGWPPSVATDRGYVRSPGEARRLILATSEYSVTPDDVSAGTEEQIPLTRVEGDARGTIFYVTTQELSSYGEELGRLADERPFVHDGWLVSEVADLSVVQFLIDRIITSPYVAREHREMLAR